MTQDRQVPEAALGALAGELETRAQPGDLPGAHRLRQAFERLALTNPQAALEALETHPEEIGRAGGDLGNLLCRTLVERKLYAEAARLLRLSRGMKLVTDAAICVRLAKALSQKGAHEDAMQALLSALAIDPTCLPAMRALYERTVSADKPDDASRWLTRMLEADASYPTAAYVYRERQKLPRRSGRAVRIAL